MLICTGTCTTGCLELPMSCRNDFLFLLTTAGTFCSLDLKYPEVIQRDVILRKCREAAMSCFILFKPNLVTCLEFWNVSFCALPLLSWKLLDCKLPVLFQSPHYGASEKEKPCSFVSFENTCVQSLIFYSRIKSYFFLLFNGVFLESYWFDCGHAVLIPNVAI